MRRIVRHRRCRSSRSGTRGGRGALIGAARVVDERAVGGGANPGTHVKKKESKLYGAHFKEIDTSVKATKIVFD